ncbi:DUF4179 domain-containing protein [Sporosarcina aquimarina]|uniref:DUF4179 domain-containing protein n=1 Tax=Sporosarcina aquimarina TaxID=114975 RepID=UPI00203B7B3E|nr:DUF4179 domain-containing protein [Sporosarcina aquimarina]MCM3757245.1 DUF4179 domain-containing protein [Sporosarcina aquimarina]
MIKQNHFKEALNEIPVPSDELDMILADAFEIKKKRKFPFKKTVAYTASVAILSLCTISSAYVSPAFAKFVTKIPVVGEAFDYFISQEDYYQAYDEISTNIGLLSTSNGIDLIIEKAFYDGNVVTLSYVIKSDVDLGTFPSFENMPTLDSKTSSGGFEGYYIEGIGHVGMMTLNSTDSVGDTVNVLWEPTAIVIDDKTIEGDWNFAFSLNALEGTHIPINKHVSTEGVTVELIDAVKTDVNLTINYLQDVNPSVHEEWMAVEAELRAIDNLGNEYQVPYNGGVGTKGADSGEDLTWNATVHGLNPEATSITFYPFAHLSNSQIDSKRIDFKPIALKLK